MTKEIIVMPPHVADVKALPLISDLQFLEIATSEALNRKMLGVVNDGIRRGFNHKIGSGLKMIMGDDSGKNTACVERDGVLLTIQGQHPVEVTLPAGKESAIVIEGFYQYGVKTKQVDANSDVDGAKIIVVDSNKTADHHVILCDVNVPLGATQITEPMISLARRKAAGLDIQSHVEHADPHVQYVKKTFQIKTALPLKGGKDLSGENLTLSIDTATTARTGTVQLIDSYTSTSAVLAPTGNALRAANQRAVDKENAIQSDLNSHKSNAANPHNVTKAQVGLGSVPNYSISDIYNSNGTNFASRTALFNAYTALNKGTTDHVGNKSNPHAVTKAQVGLGSVNNWGASTAVNSTSTTTYATASAVKQTYDLAASKLAANAKAVDSAKLEGKTKAQVIAEARSGLATDSTVSSHVNNKSNPHAVTKAQVGLGSVNNWGASTAVNSTSTTTYATASAVKQAYDLAASKLSTSAKAADSDKLDGLHASDFARSRGRVVSNYNDFRTPGMYGVDGTGTNGPSNNSYGTLIVAANSDTGLQIAGGHSNDRLAFRGWSSSGSAWRTWQNIYHTGFKPNKNDVGLGLVNNWGATAAVNSTSTTTYATASAVKQAYDLAASKAANSTVTSHIGNKSNPHAVTKAQIGLGRVNDVGLNWSWGTGNPTHIWGSQGDANESYVYNGTQLKAFIGLSAVNNWGATTAVNSTSTTTYATASAVKQAYDLAASKVSASSLANIDLGVIG